jgi:predicted DNA-binding transcriptional regulator YafY
MPSKIIYERFLWFNGQVKNSKYPSSADLAQKFEISRKTAQRDIDFMRDRLNAPLNYVSGKRGYEYDDATYALPGMWLNEEELGALLIASRLASTIPDLHLKTSLTSFLQQIVSAHSFSTPVSLEQLAEKISVKNIEYARIDDGIFHPVVDALFYQKALEIDYYSPHEDESTRRVIYPLHLLQYMGSWHVIAHCTLRDELRDFALARIRAIKPSAAEMLHSCSTASIKEYIRRNFGLMNTAARIRVCLKFCAAIMPWVSEQVWHADQIQAVQPDDSLCLTFPAADLREVKREVLKYGSQVEVLSPAALREAVKKEIEKMKKIY